ncbi:MAG: beta-glucosidase BglX [Bacteroidales bacterium]|nr:beta-glucosidase BglX [Bacteroidales bacterium]
MKKQPLLLAIILLLASCSGKSDMDKFIDGIMKDMTIEQKIGQLNLHSAGGFVSALKVTEDDANVKLLRQGLLGGVYGGSGVEYLTELQKIALESGAGIPLIFGQDVIHGFETVFPVPLALSTSWNMELIQKTARMAATEASAAGINWVFSPMVDIAHDPRWGRIVEGGGEDPYLGGEIAKAMVQGYQGTDSEYANNEVMSCVKHYALYGAAEAGRDYNTVVLDRPTAFNEYLHPYEAAAKAGAASYMSSFNEFEGIPATMNSYLMNDVLRDMWGFNGFIVSDATAVQEEIAHGIGNLQEVSARSLKAGLDMDMNSDGFIGTLQQSLKEGKIMEADIDRACRRILEAKYKLGLFQDPFKYLNPDREKSEIYTEENLAFARKVAQESMVLLKNNGTLPLAPNTRIAVVGPLSDDASAMTGAWAMSKHSDQTVSILQGLKNAGANIVGTSQGSNLFLSKEQEESVRYGMMKIFMPNAQLPAVHSVPQSTLISQAVAAARKADVVVACVGEIAEMNGEGASRSDISLPDAQQEMLKALKAVGKPIVMVLSTGRPLTLVWENENMDAILNIWAGGSEGGNAAADILYGKVNPSAKLTTSFPRSVGQLPYHYNHKNTGRPHGDYDSYRKFVSCYTDEINAPLYPFGYGLSYTTFEYGDITLSANSMTESDTITASVEVRNTGKMDGDEIVQLYIHDIYSSSTRPVRELKGFKKVHIPAGQAAKVSFDITAEELKYWNHDIEFVCEPGDFELFIGPDCTTTRKAEFRVE